jgi:hypothetical protein
MAAINPKKRSLDEAPPIASVRKEIEEDTIIKSVSLFNTTKTAALHKFSSGERVVHGCDLWTHMPEQFKKLVNDTFTASINPHVNREDEGSLWIEATMRYANLTNGLSEEVLTEKYGKYTIPTSPRGRQLVEYIDKPVSAGRPGSLLRGVDIDAIFCRGDISPVTGVTSDQVSDNVINAIVSVMAVQNEHVFGNTTEAPCRTFMAEVKLSDILFADCPTTETWDERWSNHCSRVCHEAGQYLQQPTVFKNRQDEEGSISLFDNSWKGIIIPTNGHLKIKDGVLCPHLIYISLPDRGIHHFVPKETLAREGIRNKCANFSRLLVEVLKTLPGYTATPSFWQARCHVCNTTDPNMSSSDNVMVMMMVTSLLSYHFSLDQIVNHASLIEYGDVMSFRIYATAIVLYNKPYPWFHPPGEIEPQPDDALPVQPRLDNRELTDREHRLLGDRRIRRRDPSPVPENNETATALASIFGTPPTEVTNYGDNNNTQRPTNTKVSELISDRCLICNETGGQMCVNDTCTHSFCSECIRRARKTPFGEEKGQRLELIRCEWCFTCRCYVNWRYKIPGPYGETSDGGILGRFRYHNSRLGLTSTGTVHHKDAWIALVHEASLPPSCRDAMLQGIDTNGSEGRDHRSVANDFLLSWERMGGPLWTCVVCSNQKNLAPDIFVMPGCHPHRDMGVCRRCAKTSIKKNKDISVLRCPICRRPGQYTSVVFGDGDIMPTFAEMTADEKELDRDLERRHQQWKLTRCKLTRWSSDESSRDEGREHNGLDRASDAS